MKQLFKGILFMSFFYIFIANDIYSKKSISLQQSQAIIDTTKTVFLLDNKRISTKELFTRMEKGDIKFVTGTNISKEALQYFGEKYRYGVYIYVTIKENGKDE